jgi:hypothetical protein
MLGARNSLAEAMNREGMWEDEKENEKLKVNRATYLVGWHEDPKQNVWIQVGPDAGREEFVVDRWSARREGMPVGGRSTQRP